MLGEDPVVNAARLRAVRAMTATVGQQEAQERRTKTQRKENARKRKRERQQMQRDAWAQVATEPDQWVLALSAAAGANERRDHRVQMEQAADLEAAGPMDDDPTVPHGDMSEVEDVHRSPACTHVATSDDEDELTARGAHTQVHTNDHCSPACTHINTSNDECRQQQPVQEFLQACRMTNPCLKFCSIALKCMPGRTGRRYGGKQGLESTFHTQSMITLASQWWDHRRTIGQRYQQSGQESTLCATPKSCACTVSLSDVWIFLAIYTYISAMVGWRRVNNQ